MHEFSDAWCTGVHQMWMRQFLNSQKHTEWSVRPGGWVTGTDLSCTCPYLSGSCHWLMLFNFHCVLLFVWIKAAWLQACLSCNAITITCNVGFNYLVVTLIHEMADHAVPKPKPELMSSKSCGQAVSCLYTNLWRITLTICLYTIPSKLLETKGLQDLQDQACYWQPHDHVHSHDTKIA